MEHIFSKQVISLLMILLFSFCGCSLASTIVPSRSTEPVVSNSISPELSVDTTIDIVFDSPQLDLVQWEDEIVTPLERIDIKEILKEYTFDNYTVFFYLSNKNEPVEYICAGVETSAGLFSLMTIVEYLDWHSPDKETEHLYTAEEYDKVLGHNGCKITYLYGSTIRPSVYFYLNEADTPEYLIFTFNNDESDLDGNGDSEVICYTRHYSGEGTAWDSVIFINTEQGIVWSDTLNVYLADLYPEFHVNVLFNPKSNRFDVSLFENIDADSGIQPLETFQLRYINQQLIKDE